MIGSNSPFRKNPSRLFCQENIPCIIIPPATQARDFATIVVYIVMSHCVRCHIWASEITRADLSSV